MKLKVCFDWILGYHRASWNGTDLKQCFSIRQWNLLIKPAMRIRETTWRQVYSLLKEISFAIAIDFIQLSVINPFKSNLIEWLQRNIWIITNQRFSQCPLNQWTSHQLFHFSQNDLPVFFTFTLTHIQYTHAVNELVQYITPNFYQLASPCAFSST